MNYVLLLIATLASAAKVVICKRIGRDFDSNKHIFFLNATIFAIAALTVLISFIGDAGALFSVSPHSLLLALAFAFFILFTQFTEIKAMAYGSVSMTMMIFSCGFLIPILYGCVFLKERISVFQLLGLVLLVGALVLIISPKRDESFRVLWLVFSVLAMLGSGINAVIQKLHQSSDFKDEIVPFLFYSLLFSSLFSFAMYFFTKGEGEQKATQKPRHSQLVLILFSGLCVGVLNILNLKLAGKLSAVVQFPIYSIGSMILSGLAGRFVFGERIGGRKLVGFGLGCVAITVIALL